MLTAGLLLLLSLLAAGVAWAQSDDGSASGSTTAGDEAVPGPAADASARPAGPDGQETSGAAAASGAQPGAQGGQGQAGMSAAEAAGRAAVWERLMVTLEALPDRWSILPPPCVKPSGRSAEEVLLAASESEQSAAVKLIGSIAQTPPAEPEQHMAALRQQRPWTEVDLWIAGDAIDEWQTKDFEVTGRIAEAWLSLLAHCGRRDILLSAAGIGFYLLSLRLPPERRLIAIERWLSLPLPPQGTRGSASLHQQYAGTAYSLGKNQAALAAYQKARSLYKNVGDKQGQGSTWNGEASVHFRLGANDAALKANREARRHFIDVGDKLGQGNTWLGEADVHSRLGANDAALKANREARRHFIDVGDKLGQGNTWLGEADVHSRLGANDAVLKAHREARRLFIDVGDEQGEGNTWVGEANVRFRLGANDSALKAYRQARALFITTGDKQGEGNTWYGEAGVQARLGANDAALKAYRQARALFIKTGDKPSQGNAWLGEANVRFRLGANEVALKTYRQARALFFDVGDKNGQGHAWIGEARVKFHLGANEVALKAYRQARRLFRIVGSKGGAGDAWLGEAEVQFRLGANEVALKAYRQARRLFVVTGDKRGQGNSWLGEAGVQFYLGADEAALTAYRQARSFFVDVGDKQGEGNSWTGEARVKSALGAHEAALAAYRRARALFIKTGDRQGQSHSWFGEARVQFILGTKEAALSATNKAVTFAKNDGAAFSEFNARMQKAMFLLMIDRSTDALAEAERARVVLRSLRQQNLTEVARIHVLDTASPYNLLITRLLGRRDNRAKSVERALVLAEEAHAPILLDILTTSVRSSDSKTRSEEVVRLEHRREQLEREIARADSTGRPHGLRDELAAVDAQLENERMVEVSRQNSSLANATILTRAARKQLVRAVGPVLLYYVAPEETVLFLLRLGRAPVAHRIPLSRSELQRQVGKLSRDLANPHYHRRARAVLQELFTQLIGPVVAQLSDTDRLTIIPHGPLHELPFESLLLGAMSGRSALAAGDQASQPSQRQEQRSRKNPLNHLPTLGDRWHVTIAPSLSALHTVRERKHKRDREARHRRARGAKPDDRIPFLGIASGKNLDTAPEVRQAGTLFGPASKLSLRTDGSRDTYRNYAGRAAHILLSTHGTHVAQSRFGYLDLTAKEGHAVRLTASEIATRPLVAELVTLAACETARGIAMLSDERLDLSRAFLIAGADAILATRWRVPDGDDTRQFVVDFYTALLHGGPNGTRMRKDEALTHARQLSRQRGDTAKLWAAWVLIGDGR